MHRPLAFLVFACLAACPDPAAREWEQVAAVHAGLVTGPGGVALAADPCPEAPNAQAACGRLVSARRISWFGYLARWMRVFDAFGVAPANPGGYAALPSEAFQLGVSHPDRGLTPLVEVAGSRSQYVALHELLGEPMDAFGVEDTTIVDFRAQHTLHLSAGAIKQACRIGTSLSGRVVNRLAGAAFDAQRLAAIDALLDVQHGAAHATITQIRAVKPALGYLAYGRLLTPAEVTVLNAQLATSGFRVVLTALLCSTPALVE